MSVLVRPCNVESTEWKRLTAHSHQTSLFVDSKWLAADRPVVIGAFEGGELIAGLVARDVSEGAIAPYQGLLLSARTYPAAIDALIEWVEGIGGAPVVWNAPSLVDIRPFQNRIKHGRIWTIHVRYTYFVSAYSANSGGLSPVEKTNERVQRLAGSLLPGTLSRCLLADCVAFYEDGDALVAWGVDAQKRGYLVAWAGPHIPLAKRLIRTVASADLNGTPSWAKEFAPKLRTSYGLCLANGPE